MNKMTKRSKQHDPHVHRSANCRTFCQIVLFTFIITPDKPADYVFVRKLRRVENISKCIKAVKLAVVMKTRDFSCLDVRRFFSSAAGAAGGTEGKTQRCVRLQLFFTQLVF